MDKSVIAHCRVVAQTRADLPHRRIAAEASLIDSSLLSLSVAQTRASSCHTGLRARQALPRRHLSAEASARRSILPRRERSSDMSRPLGLTASPPSRRSIAATAGAICSIWFVCGAHRGPFGHHVGTALDTASVRPRRHAPTAMGVLALQSSNFTEGRLAAPEQPRGFDAGHAIAAFGAPRPPWGRVFPASGHPCVRSVAPQFA